MAGYEFYLSDGQGNVNFRNSVRIIKLASSQFRYLFYKKNWHPFSPFSKNQRRKKRKKKRDTGKARGWKIEEGVDRFATPRDIFIGRIDERSFVPPFDKQRTPRPTVFIAPLPPYSRPRECVNFLPYIGVEY